MHVICPHKLISPSCRICAKQWRRRWFETPSCPLWCHCNGSCLMFCCDFAYGLCMVVPHNLTIRSIIPDVYIREIVLADNLVIKPRNDNWQTNQIQTNKNCPQFCENIVQSNIFHFEMILTISYVDIHVRIKLNTLFVRICTELYKTGCSKGIFNYQ